MNDAMELTDGREVLNRILELEIDQREPELPQGLWLFWTLLRAHFLERPAEDCFVTCFCEEEPRLGAWIETIPATRVRTGTGGRAPRGRLD